MSAAVAPSRQPPDCRRQAGSKRDCQSVHGRSSDASTTNRHVPTLRYVQAGRMTDETQRSPWAAFGTKRKFGAAFRRAHPLQQRRPDMKVKEAMHKGVDWVGPD